MSALSDHYEVYYSDKLWGLIPALYRQEDSDAPDVNGPLREMVNRIGSQAAVLRRTIDRLWEDQSIETCDDWIIPYIGDLLATNLVSSLDARGRRLDVANTIYYRRRAGTVGILEQIAHDVTGWDAKVVEFFRRLERTRHGLDPEMAEPAETDDPTGFASLQRGEGLVGQLTHTAIGGYADLRNVYGATQTQPACDLPSLAQSDRPAAFDPTQTGAFDEFFHKADFRAGRGKTGWHSIAGLGVFLWRLYSFGVVRATPVACPTKGLFTFDPTGRRIPLFARAARNLSDAYGDHWVTPEEWQLPTPIRRPLYDAEQAHLYPDSVAVYRFTGSRFDPIDPANVTVHPEFGTFSVAPAFQNDVLAGGYHYGFPSTIGAGPFDRRTPAQPLPPDVSPASLAQGGGAAPAFPAAGTVTFVDSLTYGPPADIPQVTNLMIRGRNRQRPLLRQGQATWTITGADDTSTLDFEGVFQSGGDVVLAGKFDTVRLLCCTFDPGTAGSKTVIDKSVDPLVDLRPTRIWIEGHIRQLVVDRSVVGPLRTRGSGDIEHLLLKDSIIQGIRTEDLGDFVEVKDADRMARRLHAQLDPLSVYVWGVISANSQQMIKDYLAGGNLAPSLNAVSAAIAAGLNGLDTAGQLIYTKARFASVQLDPATLAATGTPPPPGPALAQLNRRLLEEAYPTELADLALGTTAGDVDLERCTALGPVFAHRFQASECILDERVEVEDLQHGCVRFSAWTTGSILPRQYESVEIPRRAPLFSSRNFGHPAYGQLYTDADRTIVSGGPRRSITEGGPTGSEMGAFARELGAIKRRSLLIKFTEFMPLGLSPVIINVT